MPVYAVGDIQGCTSSFERLLGAIDFAADRDHLWLVGDLVNRGPRSLDMLRWARAHDHAITAVLGNHDLHLLARAAGVADAKKRDTLDDVLAAPDRDELIDWLRHRPLLHADDTHVMVHAGLHPHWTVARARALAAELEAGLRSTEWRAWLRQLGGPTVPWSDSLTGAARVRALLAYFVRVRCVHPDASVVPDFDGPPEDRPANTLPWYALPAPAWTTHTAIFGHWAAHGARLSTHWLALDSGCVWGHTLSAVRLSDRTLTQVPAAEPSS